MAGVARGRVVILPKHDRTVWFFQRDTMRHFHLFTIHIPSGQKKYKYFQQNFYFSHLVLCLRLLTQLEWALLSSLHKQTDSPQPLRHNSGDWCHISDHWPATFLAGKFPLLTSWAFVACRRSCLAGVAFVALFGAGRWRMRGVNNPRQRLLPPRVLLAFHNQNSPRLHTQ